jgi:phospholipid/cholesterol/gamma-HCH transport system substrate-binding protein
MALKLSREFKVGMYIVIAIGILYWGVNFLKGNDVFASGTTYYAIYKNTEGLTKAKAVQINGYQVGMIDDIYFHPDKSGRLVVRMRMQQEYPIASNTVARIHSSGLLGDKSISLLLGDADGLAKSGDTLASDVEETLTEAVNEQVAPIKAKAERLLGSLDTAVTLLTGFLNEDTRNNFVRSFDNLQRTFENLENSSEILNNYLANNQKSFTELAENLESISRNLKDNNENITNVLSNLSDVSDSLQKVNIVSTFNKVDEAVSELNVALERVNSGEGSLGALINDRELYNNLNDASDALNRLLLDIKYNPNKYVNVSVFGNKRQYSDEEIQEIEQEIRERQKEKEREEKKK